MSGFIHPAVQRHMDKFVVLLFLAFVSVGALFSVFCFLFGTARAVRPCDILLLFGLGFHLAIVVLFFSCFAKDDSPACNDVVDVTHFSDV